MTHPSCPNCDRTPCTHPKIKAQSDRFRICHDWTSPEAREIRAQLEREYQERMRAGVGQMEMGL